MTLLSMLAYVSYHRHIVVIVIIIIDIDYYLAINTSVSSFIVIYTACAANILK